MAENIQSKLKDAVERFDLENPERVYSREEKTWYKFNGKYYAAANDGFENAIYIITEEEELYSDSHLRTLRKLCEARKPIHGELNIDSEMLLNTPSGVMDIRKLHALHEAGLNPKEHLPEWIFPHDEYKRNRLTEITGASYDHISQPPTRFLNFIEELFLGDLELVRYFLKFLTYCLTGLTSQQYLHILYGIGRNGKSTLLKIIEAIFGTYYCSLTTSIIELRGDIERAYRTLYYNRFKRLTVYNEPGEKTKLNLPLIKLITGEDSIPVKINRQEKMFNGYNKIFLNTNFIPTVGSIENIGIWERLRVISTRPPIPQNQRIEDFYKLIIEEKNQIFTYLIDTYLNDVLKHGVGDIPEIMTLMKLFKEFSEDPVEFFFDRTIKLSDIPLNNSQWVQARMLHGQYWQFHLLVARAFERMLQIKEGNDSRKVLVSPKSDTFFSRRMQQLGAFEKKSSEKYFTNIFFSAERVYSDFGESVENADLKKLKHDFLIIFENGYIENRRIMETLAPIKQLKEMGQMGSEIEPYFEEPSAVPEPNSGMFGFNQEMLNLLMNYNIYKSMFDSFHNGGNKRRITSKK